MWFSRKCFFALLLTTVLTVRAALDRNPKVSYIFFVKKKTVLPMHNKKFILCYVNGNNLCFNSSLICLKIK